jgi:titin
VLVLGNYIGTDHTGTKALGNSIGIESAGSNNSIGGGAVPAHNVISGNSKDGVLIDSTASGVQLLGNYIGTSISGTAVLGNSIGVEIAGNGNIIGGSYATVPNLISGNSDDGVRIDSGASGNTVAGNYIGTNSAGTAAMGNKVGIEDGGRSNTIGGSVLGARNIISGNTGDGVLNDYFAVGETMQGNYIGLNASGNTALANGGNGVEIQGAVNLIGGNSGSNYYVRNFISGNGKDGVFINSINASNGSNRVQGNFIGVGVSGTNGVGNLANGIEVSGTPNTIGGTISGYTNVISGNGNDGVLVDSTASFVLLQGNYVGTDYTGKSAVGNSGNGMEILSIRNTVGGTVSGARNIISGNSKDGVLVSTGSDNTISRNSIFANGGLGIDLTNGANNNIAAPTLLTATLSSGTLTVTGTFNAPTANVSYVLEFFANPSGDAEGKIFLGSLTVTPTTIGTQSFTFTTTTTVTGTYPLITATLTDNLGDTSELSTGVTVS